MKIDFRTNLNVIRRVDYDKKPTSPVKEAMRELEAKREAAGLRKARREARP